MVAVAVVGMKKIDLGKPPRYVWINDWKPMGVQESYAVLPPTFEPITAVCPLCKGKLKVKASTRAWPKCPECEETMERYRGDEEDVVN